MKTKNTIEKINTTRNWFIEKVIKICRFLARFTKERERGCEKKREKEGDGGLNSREFQLLRITKI